ncbi:hypothetical protein [Aquibacillus rhizosphaerae]|uniref:Uncharacterized protein n=1 Tax=Aquibacillus rhizosphaerae TaxID=3051431 RepID=A0ABT7LAF0_9BACI|nr:hypothetical protein [Aquibacillus sp. LR5S19]MDL4842828.1 hypothetical protein [Aquibacillus sp. LR5S19]
MEHMKSIDQTLKSILQELKKMNEPPKPINVEQPKRKEIKHKATK